MLCGPGWTLIMSLSFIWASLSPPTDPSILTWLSTLCNLHAFNPQETRVSLQKRCASSSCLTPTSSHRLSTASDRQSASRCWLTAPGLKNNQINQSLPTLCPPCAHRSAKWAAPATNLSLTELPLVGGWVVEIKWGHRGRVDQCYSTAGVRKASLKCPLSHRPHRCSSVKLQTRLELIYAHRCEILPFKDAVKTLSASCIQSLPLFQVSASHHYITTGPQRKERPGCLAGPFVNPAALIAIGHLTKA